MSRSRLSRQRSTFRPLGSLAQVFSKMGMEEPFPERPVPCVDISQVSETCYPVSQVELTLDDIASSLRNYFRKTKSEFKFERPKSRLFDDLTLDFSIEAPTEDCPTTEWLNVLCPSSDTDNARFLPRNLSFCAAQWKDFKQSVELKEESLGVTLDDLDTDRKSSTPQTTMSKIASEAVAWLSDEADSVTSDLLSSEDSSDAICAADQADLTSFFSRSSENSRNRRPSSILRKERSKSFPPPTRRTTKKVVRFADSLGLELETVRHLIFSDLPPYIPSKAFSDLHQFENSMELEAEFSNPCSRVDFTTRLRRQGVILHSIRSYYTSVYGLVSVVNLSYHKWVTVRYSLNGWKTHCDTRATYVPRPSDAKATDIDQFRFTIFANPKDFHGAQLKLSFAVCYKTEDGQERWDNNGGLNYNMIGHYKQSPNESNNGRTWVHFI